MMFWGGSSGISAKSGADKLFQTFENFSFFKNSKNFLERFENQKFPPPEFFVNLLVNLLIRL
jgi:hypothetical protein